MSIGSSIDIHFEESIKDLTKHLSKRQRRGTWVALVAQSSSRVAMAKTHSPVVLEPWDAHDFYANLRKKLESAAVIEGVNLEEAKTTTIVQLFPETGKINYAQDAYSPNDDSRFVFEIKLGNPTSTLYF